MGLYEKEARIYIIKGGYGPIKSGVFIFLVVYIQLSGFDMFDVTENGVPPSGNTRAVVGQSVAGRARIRGGQVQVA